MVERPKTICLCGSTRFIEQEREVYFRLSLAGNIVLSHSGRRVPGKPTGGALDVLHLRKIDLADEVLVLNVDGYIGESTRNEIAYAEAHGKPVSYLEPTATTAPPATPAAEGEVAMSWLEARKFVSDWLWKSKDRETGGLPWSAEYTNDAAHMIRAALASRDREVAGLKRRLAFYDEIGEPDWCDQHPRRFSANAREGDEGLYDECQICRAERAEQELQDAQGIIDAAHDRLTAASGLPYVDPLAPKVEAVLARVHRAEQERDERNIQLAAWAEMFGTSQLTHAVAERDALRASHAELLARLAEKHHPFTHDYEKAEKSCPDCCLIARAKALP